MTEVILQALGNILTPQVLLVILLAAIYGIVVGSIPGLTATMAVALIVPFTFFMDDISALAAIVTLVACSIFAGDIPTTLVRIPGTPSSAAYTDDAYAMTLAGRHEQSLSVSLVFSVIGGLFGAVILFTAAPQLAKIAFQFTTYEYFWLVVLGLSCAAVVSHGSRVKGALSLVIGLLFSSVGLSEVHSVPRFTFGQDELVNGINFLPAMIGLFGISEVLRITLQRNVEKSVGSPPEGSGLGGRDTAARSVQPLVSGQRGSLVETLGLAWRRKIHVLRSAAIGSFVGMLPGAGADIAAWISYAVSKRFAKKPEDYGKGSLEAIADATGANNSALAGAWIPALVFGIPGDSITAIVIGVLLMKNITPGPQIFTDPEQSVLVYGIYITFILANLVLIPIGFLAIRAGSVLIRIPRSLLLPGIIVASIVGSYAISGSYFDVAVMLGMGLLGFVLETFGVPLGPLVLGVILGGKLEHTFIQNLTKSDSLFEFFTRPISLGLGTSCILLWLTPLLTLLWRRSKAMPAGFGGCGSHEADSQAGA